MKASYATNPEPAKAKAKAYADRNKETVAAKNKTRRMARIAALTPEQQVATREAKNQRERERYAAKRAAAGGPIEPAEA